MRDTDIFELALGLSSPWKVKESIFDPESKRLDIVLHFARGSTLTCPDSKQAELKAHDTVKKTWRHLNFFQHDAYLTAKVPRIKCRKCGVKLVEIPWARPGSGFTLLVEAMVMTLAKAMPVKTISEFVGEHDTRLWRMINHYVDLGREAADYSSVQEVGFDETSSKRGHDYVSLFIDLAGPNILFATPGKDSSTVKRFKEDLINHGGSEENIKQMCCDMSPAFIKGVADQFPEAELTFNKFHIVRVVNEAVDKVRREEQKEHPELIRSRYAWLKNPQNLTQKQADKLNSLIVKKLNLKTSRVYHIKLNFQEIFNQPLEAAEPLLKKWFFWATHSRLQLTIDSAYTIKRHWNGILEGLNSLVQAAKARVRGYRSNKNLIAMIYLIGGKFNFGLPT